MGNHAAACACCSQAREPPEAKYSDPPVPIWDESPGQMTMDMTACAEEEAQEPAPTGAHGDRLGVAATRIQALQRGRSVRRSLPPISEQHTCPATATLPDAASQVDEEMTYTFLQSESATAQEMLISSAPVSSALGGAAAQQEEARVLELGDAVGARRPGAQPRWFACGCQCLPAHDDDDDHGPKPHMPEFKSPWVPFAAAKDWKRLGGPELAPPLSSGAVALLDAQHLLDLAGQGGKVSPRQALPSEAFVSLAEVKAFTTRSHVLPIVCFSHCWLQADHPDPRGHNLRAFAASLKLLVNDRSVLHYGGRWAVLLDFCSIHQACRNAVGTPDHRNVPWLEDSRCYAHGAVGRYDTEEALFHQALGHWGAFYSHPKTLVFMLTAPPPDFDNPQAYSGTGTSNAYFDRGWCFCEARWSMLVKDFAHVLDIGKASGRAAAFGGLKSECAQQRRTPMLPAAFASELESKGFMYGSIDRPRVAALYTATFEARLRSATVLRYNDSGWGDQDVCEVASVLGSGAAQSVEALHLAGNNIGEEGAKAIAGALPQMPSLKDMWMSSGRLTEASKERLKNACRVKGVQLRLFDY